MPKITIHEGPSSFGQMLAAARQETDAPEVAPQEELRQPVVDLEADTSGLPDEGDVVLDIAAHDETAAATPADATPTATVKKSTTRKKAD